MVTVVFATTDFDAMYLRMGLSAEDAGQVGAMTGQMRGFSIASGVIAVVVLVGLYATEWVFLRKGGNRARIVGIVAPIQQASRGRWRAGGGDPLTARVLGRRGSHFTMPLPRLTPE